MSPLRCWHPFWKASRSNLKFDSAWLPRCEQVLVAGEGLMWWGFSLPCPCPCALVVLETGLDSDLASWHLVFCTSASTTRHHPRLKTSGTWLTDNHNRHLQDPHDLRPENMLLIACPSSVKQPRPTPALISGRRLGRVQQPSRNLYIHSTYIVASPATVSRYDSDKGPWQLSRFYDSVLCTCVAYIAFTDWLQARIAGRSLCASHAPPR